MNISGESITRRYDELTVFEKLLHRFHAPDSGFDVHARRRTSEVLDKICLDDSRPSSIYHAISIAFKYERETPLP